VGSASLSYKGHRYPVEVISHCVWLYHRFPLSFREVEELMLERGIVVSYETVRRWCVKFGPAYARELRRRWPRPGDKRHLDEVLIKINGEQKYLWRAVPARRLGPGGHRLGGGRRPDGLPGRHPRRAGLPPQGGRPWPPRPGQDRYGVPGGAVVRHHEGGCWL
jgi:hypothetical protein